MAEVFLINGIEYEFECKLTNPDGQEISFTKSAIQGMTLIDNLFGVMTSATISIANPYDYIEDSYFLRGDGRDRVHLMFKPKEGEDNSKIENEFVVVNDTDTVNPMARSENIKTLDLMDVNFVPFMDLVPYGKVYSGKVGKLVQELFIELLGDDVVDKENWEEGDFSITFIPPVTYRYIDVLGYLIRMFYGKDEDIFVKGFLGRSEGKYNLKFISKLFAKNNDETQEAFPLGDLTSEVDTDNPNNPQSGPEVKEYIGGLRNLGYSTPMYDWTKDYFLNAVVTGYDPTMGQQRIQVLKFDDVRDKWTKKFVDVFKSISGKPKPFAIKNDTTKKRFKFYKFPYPVEDCVKLVEAEMHNNLTFINLQISFSNIGDSKRRAGKFIDVFTTRGDTKLKSDEKILGRWLVTEVRHIFLADLYINQLYACKTYIGPNSNVKEDVK